jgi:hypothetical protein
MQTTDNDFKMKKYPYHHVPFLLLMVCVFLAFILNLSLAFSDQEWSRIRPPNCKCHSKNPKMVAMHKPFGVKDCFVCHQPETMQMQEKGEKGKRKRMELAKKKRTEEKVCKGCHTLKDDLADTLK